MRLVLDNIIFELQKSGGISVVWYELLTRLLQSSSMDIQFIDNPETDNYLRRRLTIGDQRIIGRSRCVSITRALPVRVDLRQPFVFHSSYYRYCTNPLAVNVSTIHDFTNEIFGKGIKKQVHSWQKFRALRKSDYIICISEHTKKDLRCFLPDIAEERIRVIYNGVSDDYHVIEHLQEKDLQVLPFPEGSYVLFVGSRADYKNFDLVVRCVAQSQYHLVIVGPELTEKELELLKSCMAADRYKQMHGVPNQMLNVLYNRALCLAYPSSYEGFGIPVVEAQKAGCPVIAYDATSVKEIAGNSSFLMSELSDRCFMEKLRLLKSREVVEETRSQGIVNARRFTWDVMYQSYAHLYEEIANERKRN